jgi:hypothetical protein
MSKRYHRHQMCWQKDFTDLKPPDKMLPAGHCLTLKEARCHVELDDIPGLDELVAAREEEEKRDWDDWYNSPENPF